MAKNMKYGWKYYLEPSPKNVMKWVAIVKAPCVFATAGGIGSEVLPPMHGAALVMIGYFLDEIIKFLGSEPPKPEPPKENNP